MNDKEANEFLTDYLGALDDRILNQLNTFRNNKITNVQIICAVCYWFDVKKKNKSELATFGLGIVPNIYLEAEQHYKRIKKQYDKRFLAGTEMSKTPPAKVFVRSSPKRTKERRVLSLDD